MGNPRNVAILMGVAALLMIVGVATKSWYTANESREGITASVAIGLTSVEMCISGELIPAEDRKCVTTPYSKVPEEEAKKDKTFFYAGKLTLFGGIFAAILLLGACVMSLTGNSGKGPVDPRRLAQILTPVALLGAIVFVANKPDNMTEPSIGFSAIVFFLGAIAGIASTVLGGQQTATAGADDAAAPAPAAPFAAEPAPAAPAASEPAPAPEPEPEPEAASADDGGEDEENEG